MDDNDDLRMILAHQLHQKGYRAIMAGDGQQGIDKCIHEKPDVILMDIMMPGMDGTEAASHIIAHPEVGKTPIIFLTSMIEAGEPIVTVEPTIRVSLPKATPVDDLCGWIEQVLSKKLR